MSEQRVSAAQKLCREGLAVSFETIGTIHQCALFEGEESEQTDSSEVSPSASLQWEVLEYGLPVIISNENGVVLCLADLESGNKLCEFAITSATQYVVVDGHFHVIGEPSGCYGISFADSDVGEKIMTYLKRIISITESNQQVQADGAQEEEEEGFEEVDGPFHRRKSTKKKSKETPPGDFRAAKLPASLARWGRGLPQTVL